MRKLPYLVLALLIFAIACKKSVEPIQSDLIGKWTFTESYISPAGPTDWQPVTPPNQTIEFKSDGTFIPCESFLKGANHFEIVDSVTVKIQPAAPSGFILMRYDIKPLERALYLSPTNPICIEGCSSKFEQ